MQFQMVNGSQVPVVTTSEWERTPDEYRTIKSGTPHLLYLDPTTGATVLGPCVIVSELQMDGRHRGGEGR